MRSEKTLVLLNYTVDSSHPVLSHQSDVAIALCEKFTKVVVITAGPRIEPELPNLHIISTGWEQRKALKNVINLYRIFLAVLNSEKDLIVFSHMTEMQSALLSPLTKFLKIRHILWYAHAHHSIGLRASSLFVDKILTSTSGSCPVHGKKVLTIGQAIDPKKFPSKSFDFKLQKFTHVGRFDVSKRIDQIIQFCEVIRKNGVEISLTLIGSPSNTKNLIWARALEANYASYEYKKWLKFEGGVPRTELVHWLQNSDVFVHAFQGSLDKTLLEATLVMLPVLTINHEYHEIFGTWSNVNSPSLEDEYKGLLSKTGDEIRIELERRKRLVIVGHSFEGWINRVTDSMLN